MNAANRTQVTATQVLQRMDTATSPGAMQVRADTRRLEVGIPSPSYGWVEVRATSGESGRVDAALHLQNGASAQVLASQIKDISDYAREHSVHLNQISVGMGNGDGARRDPSSSGRGPENDGESQSGQHLRSVPGGEQANESSETVSLISLRV